MHSEASAEHAAGYVQLASLWLWGEPQLPAVFLQAKSCPRSCPVPWSWCNGVFLGKGSHLQANLAVSVRGAVSPVSKISSLPVQLIIPSAVNRNFLRSPSFILAQSM